MRKGELLFLSSSFPSFDKLCIGKFLAVGPLFLLLFFHHRLNRVRNK